MLGECERVRDVAAKGVVGCRAYIHEQRVVVISRHFYRCFLDSINEALHVEC